MKQKKMEERLRRRQVAHANMVNRASRFDTKIMQRLNTGGYRCPGSPKQN